MRYTKRLTQQDVDFVKNKFDTFLPDKIYDIHAHLYLSGHFQPDALPFLHGVESMDCNTHRQALMRYMPVRTIHGLYFGMPHLSAERDPMNNWVKERVTSSGTSLCRTLKVVAPQDDRLTTAEDLSRGPHIGIKVYHVYSGRTDSFNAEILEYAPEWMWDLLNDIQGVLMLHIVKDGGIADLENQRQIKFLCAKYPRVKLILAHVARSFNYRNAIQGLAFLSDLDNVVVDTSAITEVETFRLALKQLGSSRLLWGSDFPVSEMRGKCITTGEGFMWLHPEMIKPVYQPSASKDMTLVGIESLLTIREACEEEGLTQTDISDIFYDNAVRVLQPHLPIHSDGVEGHDMWKRAKTVISGGTGLLSKRAEMFSGESWPTYFSRCKGCEVWDMSGRRYLDFAGGIGAVLLGYNDPDVTNAVKKRLALGTYCSLISPDEVTLAEKLLALHPWANKVRYARGGGEAMAIAVRIARAAAGRSGVAFCGYHGWHDWYLAANLGETSALDGHLLPGLMPKGVPSELRGTAVPFRYNDIDSFYTAVETLGDNFGVVVMEPMRSQYPVDGFYEKIMDVCRRKGVIFIFDEITSGFRYGYPGAHTRLGITPDIAVYAKAISNGVPFAAIVGRGAVMEKADDSFISSSYWTDGIGPAAALATIQKFEKEDVYKKVWSTGEYLKQQLQQLAAKYPACGIAIGGMSASPTLVFEVGGSAAKDFYIRGMSDLGFLVSSVYYIMYAHEEHIVRELLQALEAVFIGLEQAVKSGTLESQSNKKEQMGFARLA